jgi:hypothetical protein
MSQEESLTYSHIIHSCFDIQACGRRVPSSVDRGTLCPSCVSKVQHFWLGVLSEDREGASDYVQRNLIELAERMLLCYLAR